LTSVVVALLAVALISPWISPYVVILSLGTFMRWLALALLVNMINACQWVCNLEDVHRPAMRAGKAVIVGVIVSLIFGTVLHRQLREQYNGNYSGFLKVSRSFFEANPLVNQDPNIKSNLILVDNGGYDGQLMYFAAFDPFLRAFRDRPAAYEQVMGSVRTYRLQPPGACTVRGTLAIVSGGNDVGSSMLPRAVERHARLVCTGGTAIGGLWRIGAADSRFLGVFAGGAT
jgi:hypothetical protein